MGGGSLELLSGEEEESEKAKMVGWQPTITFVALTRLGSDSATTGRRPRANNLYLTVVRWNS
jgi:hypothetical protein